MIHGHARERAQIAALVRAVRAGSSQALLIEGPPGIGKSTLLGEAVAGAGDLRVLRAQGFESEQDLAYAGLFELLLPILDLADVLPATQRQALHGALAIEAAAPRDRFAVPVAVVSLIGAATEQGPLLIVADDIQWLDEATRDVIATFQMHFRPSDIGGIPDPETAALIEAITTPNGMRLVQPDGSSQPYTWRW